MLTWSYYNTLVVTDNGGALFFNARTGALIRLSKERHAQTRESAIPQDLRDFFLVQGFLVKDGTDELSEIQARHEASRESKEAFSATVELTEACNFRCVYCYQDHAPSHLSDEAAGRIVRYLSRKLEGVRHLHVNWFGGEPLIRLSVMESMARQIGDAARALGRTFSQFITTNGYLLTADVAERLRRMGIENVQITLDGDESSHNRLRVLGSGKGTYQQVLAACRNVVSVGIDLMVRVNVNRWNADRIGALLADLTSRGISPRNTVIHLVRAVDHGNCGDETSSLFFSNSEFAGEWVRSLEVVLQYGFGLPTLEPRAYNCAFDLGQTVMIGRDASIRHCSSSSGRISNLTETGEEADRTTLHDVIKERRPTDDTECKECRYLPMCMGGCSYLQELGQEKCNPERHVLPELLRLTARQAEQINNQNLPRLTGRQAQQ